MPKLWVGLIVTMIVVGFIGITVAAQGNYESADKWAWVAAILMVVYFIFTKLMEGNIYHDNNTCSRCHGTGKVIEYKVGLGQKGLLPAAVEVPCPGCGGQGRI